MEFRDYYSALGVERGASADEIKRAYRKLARKYHPDVSKEPGAEQKMQEINEAWAVLSDPEKRAAYDQLGRSYRAGQEFRPPPDWDAGFEFSRGAGPFGAQAGDFSDFFASLFGGFGRAGPAGRDAFRMRGEDHHAKVMIDLEDALHGATRQITLRVPSVDAHGHVALRERTLNVRIPQGVRDGQQIRLAGQGMSGSAGGPAGDLYLEVRFRPHPRYRVDGRDIFETVPVAPWELALGATIKVPTPTGTVEVKVPPGSQTGRKLRLKGRGIPGSPPGDLYLVMEVVLPPADSDRARRLYETMARELGFDPRRGLGG
ncbi:MAG TPA: DnaJ C-terminal domain-containing protein [Rhodocyclaceae bacterium]|nr:DnaJ C-terminal domain-containing protein [Rhodocyclaceae bacterium]